MTISKLTAKTAAIFLAAAAACSCIENDTPWPTVKGAITGFEVEGQKSVAIDPSKRTVVVDLLETADPANLRVTQIGYVETGSGELHTGSVIDLTEPLTTVVKTVAGYEWTISATQTIERRFAVENQLGSARFDEQARTAIAFVPIGTDLTRITVTELKLGPAGQTTLSRDLQGKTVSFRGDDRVKDIVVKYRKVEQTWSLYVIESATQLNRVDAFARRVWLEGAGRAALVNGFEYQMAQGYDPEDENAGWITIPDADVTHSGGVFKTCLRGLIPETEYVVRAFSGDDYSEIQWFTTEATRKMPNAGFEEWHFGENKGKDVWNPWPLGGEQFWDTGNPGVATLGDSNSVPTEKGEGCPANPGGIAAKLETRFVNFAGIGKIAGGNIYVGRYGETTGLNGTCGVGKPWDARPTKLKGWYRFFPQRIDHVGTLHQSEKSRWMGTVDTMHVCVALWASPDGENKPFTVNSDPDNFVDFSKNEPGVIAYGAFKTNVEQADWKQFTVDIEYFNTDPLPSNTVLYFLVTPSKSCNYFTAATGSLAYVDEFSLEYD